MADLNAARALWGKTGDEAPAGPRAEPTGLDEYMNAIESLEVEEHAVRASSARERQLAAIADFASSAPAPVNPAHFAAPGRVIGVDGPVGADFVYPSYDMLNLVEWQVKLGKFSWTLSPQEQAEIVAVLKRALARHLEEEHKALIEGLANAITLVGVADEEGSGTEVYKVREASDEAASDVPEVPGAQPKTDVAFTNARPGRP